MARYLLTRSEGTIGEITHLLMDAAVAAIESGEEAINQATLLMAAYAGPTGTPAPVRARTGVSRPRRWPLHPEPGAGEALSSWLTRLAQLYDLPVIELLRYNLGALADVHHPRDLDPMSLDLAAPRSVLSALQERTGVDEQDLRRMTIAGWVPWLLDDVQPDAGTETFTTYVRQDSVLLPPRRSPVGQAPNWRPWLPAPPLPALMNRACRQCISDPDRGLSLMAKIALMLTCPEHGCRLDEVLGHPAEYLVWSEPEPARPVSDAVLVMDRLTHEGLSTGTVTLPRRPVNVGVWLRLLRTLLDEVATGSTRLPTSKAEDLRRIWRESGHPYRDGLGAWKVYEKLAGPGSRRCSRPPRRRCTSSWTGRSGRPERWGTS